MKKATASNRVNAPPSDLLQSALAPRPTIAERLAAGKAVRSRVPRAAHAEYKPSPKRKDPISIIEAQAKSRLPQLVPIRHSRMLVSPFAYLRGSAAVMIADIAQAPVTGMGVQACGDMHVSNFGVFASAERNLVFGINDFDETMPGPWEWDVKRLAASAVVCLWLAPASSPMESCSNLASASWTTISRESPATIATVVSSFTRRRSSL
jgi:hypothetical protein